MWSVIVGGIVSVVKGYFEVKQSKQEAEKQYNTMLAQGEQSWDIEAMKASRYSWKDELITLIWFSPLIIGWFKRTEQGWQLRDAEEWIMFVGELPLWWQVGAFGIIAASFGLRWYFNKQDFKIGKP